MTSISKAIILFLGLLTLGCQTKSQTTIEPEDADVFKETPSQLNHVLQIAKNNEAGERIVIKGKVFESDGITPAANVLMYFYHTDAKGIYSKNGNEPRNSLAWWHGYNRGWLKTNNNGEYEMRTIKPAPYPTRIEPGHIHVVVKAPSQNKAYPVGAFVFHGDELITEEYLYKVEQNGHPRDTGIVLQLNKKGILEGHKDIVLYAQYDASAANSGLLKNEECPAFRPHHIWGPDKGSTACPMCKYGNKQGVMVWINTDDWENIAKIATALEREITKVGPDKIRAFLIYMNPSRWSKNELESQLQQFAKENKLEQVAILSIPSPEDEKTAGLYRINPSNSIRNTLFVYKNRRVFEKKINLEASQTNLSLLFESISKATH